VIRDDLGVALKRDEGSGPMHMGRYLPYFDCCGKFFRDCTCAKQGKLTIGYGWNLEANGLPQTPVDWLLDYAITESSYELQRRWPFLADMDGTRYAVLVQMIFNLGGPKLAGFRKMWAALKVKDYDRAAEEMVHSTWATQVKGRALRLALQMRTGTWVD
jgi:lysozyme